MDWWHCHPKLLANSRGGPATTRHGKEMLMIPVLTTYDWIVLNSSAGKDSQAMLDYVVECADHAGIPRTRLVVVHADLGRVEWPGTKELAQEQARHYGLAFIAIARPQGDLLDHIAKRGMFPSPKARYCTSDHKRGQVAKVFTQLADLSRQRGVRVCRILNCLGLRAEESPARARRLPFGLNEMASNGRRLVHDWLPIHGWSTTQVWDRIRKSGVPHHPAYDLGMPRLSCCFCIFSPRSGLLLAGKHNPALLAEYVAVEKQIGHRFRKELALAEIQDALAKGEQPGSVSDWLM
jgi:3'-phosphoadenosine 5'-phosphosulfate sulfotransferase (PAPS reductase)/FAD synthetase